MSKFSQFFKRSTEKLRNRQRVVSLSNLPVLLGSIIVLLGATYLVQVNRSATKNFTVRALVEKHDALMDQRRELELQQAQLTALTNLEVSPVVSQLVASTNVEYLTPPTADVARR
ncbi:MAG: hypothetical protein AAB445_01770 [Patescibacteria group bacterium]